MGRDIDIKSGHPSDGYHTLRAFVIPVEVTGLTSNLPIGLNIIKYVETCFPKGIFVSYDFIIYTSNIV